MSILNLCSILQHLKSTLAESTREHILYLTTLVTLSDRIAHDSYIPGIRRGTYELEFKQAKARLLENRRNEEGSSSSFLPPPAKRAKLEAGKGNKLRWSMVGDMSQWVKCPLGLAPGQTEVSPTMFDLPASLDGPQMATNITTSRWNTQHNDVRYIQFANVFCGHVTLNFSLVPRPLSVPHVNIEEPGDKAAQNKWQY